MANENERMEYSEVDGMEDIDFDELEEKLQNDLDEHLSELEFLKEDREKISNPDNLGETVMVVVWEQFLNQLAATAGEDFIRENRGLTLDLRSDAHIQTTEDFEKGAIATHNDKIDFQKRYDDWQDNFQKNDNGEIITKYDNRSNSYKEVLKKGARDPFDKGRPKGSKSIHLDHTIPVANIIRDPKANAHLSKDEQVAFANGSANLQPLDARANESKGDSTTSEFLSSKRDGKSPEERFDIDKEKMIEDEKNSNEEFENLNDKGEKKSIETGKQSQKEEAFRMTGMALRAVVMQLLAELMKEVIRKLILWFKSAQKNMESLLDSIKLAIKSFISKLKTNLVNAGNTLVTTVTAAIFGPVVRTVKKAWTMLKQGWKSLKEAIAYIRNPDNKNKPFGTLVLEIGKIVVVGLSAAGAIVLGEVIEKGLMLSVPVFAFEIPMLGSLASLIGLFLGGLVAGIIGAIAISLIDKAVAKQQIGSAIEKEVKKGNEVLNKQNLIINVSESIKEQKKNHAADIISNRHSEAAILMKNALGKILHEEKNEIIVSENAGEFDKMFNSLKKLQE